MTSPTNTPLADKAREIAIIAAAGKEAGQWRPEDNAVQAILDLMAEAVELAAGGDEPYKEASKMTSHYNAKRKGANQLRVEQRLLAERLRKGQV